MKGYHIHLGKKPSRLERGFKEGRELWYTTEKDSGWGFQWKDIANYEHNGHYTVYEVDIPEKSITQSLENTDTTKVLIIRRSNLNDFKKVYKNELEGSRAELLKELSKRYAGVDVNDEELWRTKTYKLINMGPKSGVIWRFVGTGITVKQIEKV